MPTNAGKLAEQVLYEPVKEYLSQKLNTHLVNHHLEITAQGAFSETLKRVLREDIVFSFLRTESPDLTGFVLRKNIDNRLATAKHVESYITVEVKTDI